MVAKQLSDGRSDGVVIGKSVTDPVAFFGNTPIVQTSGADQQAAPAGGSGATAGAYDTAANRDIMINLVNEMRTTLVNAGLMKGSA